MNQKRFVSIIVVGIVVAILLGITGYFVFVKKSVPITQQTSTPTPNPTQTITPTGTANSSQTPSVQPTSKQNENNARVKMAEINDLLSSAGIIELRDWGTISQCGPWDEFIGYAVSHSQKEISLEQATELKLMAMERRFNIDNWGEKLSPSQPSYSIAGNGWDMRVLALGDLLSITDGVVKKGGRPEERWYLTPNIPVKELPADLPHSPSMCG